MKQKYICPQCSLISLLELSSYKEAVRLKRLCRSCGMKKWQENKYGKKEILTYESTCPKCNSIKKHKVKNPLSITQSINLSKQASKHLCYSCSNSIHYTLPKSKYNTKPEIEFKNILNILNIKYIQNYKFIKYNYDFYLPDLDVLIEIDGNYWHGKNLNENELNITQLHNKKHDLKKNKLCLDNQKILIRFWEDELNEVNIKSKLKYNETS